MSMRFVCALAVLTFLGLATVPVFASSPNVGEDAPELGPHTWAVNEPETYQFSDLRPEAIFVEFWGMD